jgi:hypothetical protein
MRTGFENYVPTGGLERLILLFCPNLTKIGYLIKVDGGISEGNLCGVMILKIRN